MSSDARTGRLKLDDFRHTALGDVGSTNTECLTRARAGDPGLHWITAARQTAGRGRRGRPWMSEPGNLYASLLLIDPAPMERLHSLPLAVAVAVQRAIQGVMPVGSRPVTVKWPNDVLIAGKKTCGILLEGEGLPGGHHALVIGCGINIAIAPDHGLYPVTSLQAKGRASRRTNCLPTCSEPWRKCWISGTGAGAYQPSSPNGVRWRAELVKR